MHIHTHTKEVSFQGKWYSKTLIVIQELKFRMCICDRSHRRGSLVTFYYEGNKKSYTGTRAGEQTRVSLQNGSVHGKLRAYQRGRWVDQSTLNANVVVVNLLYPPFLHFLWVTHLHSENTAHITSVVLIKHPIQIPFYSAGKKIRRLWRDPKKLNKSTKWVQRINPVFMYF